MEQLESIIADIEALSEEEYEGVERAPSPENSERAVSFLKMVQARLAGPFPAGYASTTGGGDIRIYWTAPKSSLDLIFPESPRIRPRLYEAWGDRESCLSNDISPEYLALRLADFSKRRNAEIQKDPAARIFGSGVEGGDNRG